jgi:hypothetical protein
VVVRVRGRFGKWVGRASNAQFVYQVLQWLVESLFGWRLTVGALLGVAVTVWAWLLSPFGFLSLLFGAAMFAFVAIGLEALETRRTKLRRRRLSEEASARLANSDAQIIPVHQVYVTEAYLALGVRLPRAVSEIQMRCEVTWPNGITRETSGKGTGITALTLPSTQFPDAPPLTQGQYSVTWHVQIENQPTTITVTDYFMVSPQ